MEIKSKLENLVKKHRLLNEKLREETARLVTDATESGELLKRYTPEVAAQKLQERIDADVLKTDALDKLSNAEAKSLIEQAKAAALPAAVRDFRRPSDYEQKISNALAFLAAEGEDLTDSTAYGILKPFLDDWEQLRLFERVVMRHTKKGNELAVRKAFPRTLGDVLDAADYYITVFHEAETLAETIFLSKKEPSCRCELGGEHDVSGGYTADSYAEMAAQDRLLELAGVIEEMGNSGKVVSHTVNSTPETARRALYSFEDQRDDDRMFNWV